MGFPVRLVHMIRPEGFVEGPDFRRRVEWLMFLRLFVTTLLLAATILFQFRESRNFFVDPAIPLYILIGTTFLLSLIYTFSLPMISDLWVFSFVQVMVDVVYATVLIHFTGGAQSVFTLLYAFPIITSGILHFRRGALFTASAASVLFGLLINLQFYGVIHATDWPWVSPWARQTTDYLLWVLIVHLTFFYLIAIAASSLAEQLQSTRVSLTRRESEYKRLSELHTNIVRSIPSGIITTDGEDRITFVNSAGSALLSIPLSELVSVPLSTVFPCVANGLAAASDFRRTYLTVKDIQGEKLDVELTVSDLRGTDGSRRGRLVVFQDVTQVRKMEDRVRISEKQAAFVRIAAGMAHEIRNPLASLRGASELLSQRSPGLEHERKLLGIIIRESDRLNSLLGDFLTMVSSSQPKKVRVMLTDLVEEVISLFSTQSRVGDGVTLETLIHKGVEVEGEPARLRQAFWNLFINALEAIPGGGVISIILESDAGSGHAILKVQDTGNGIPPEIRERLFEPFTTTKEGGTGLGLALVLSVVRAHHGSIETDSAPGLGSLFTVRIPLAAPEWGMAEGGKENG